MDMKICIVAEGCYPYVVGGVSGWINSMIKSFPDVEFILLAIVANRTVRGKFAYETSFESDGSVRSISG